ncbi:CHY zinc finger protein [Sporosarcina sp. 179-K 8C2 HS]|uniref:CHY zinc finger protein n=1 Tax=Sporosarcina sp. 179-K 8C2 HS TaxID=3142387 RepID=UPI0039A22A2C
MKAIKVMGNIIDQETRCTHYHSELDIIAIKFYCCQTYYPCFSCHEESGCGDHKVWPKETFGEKAVLCGKCKYELTVDQYKNSGYRCPSCEAKFNPGCGLHWGLYFENKNEVKTQ